MTAFERLREDVALGSNRPEAVRMERPNLVIGGVVVTCPHSGRFYPPELSKASQLDQHALRRSEDAFVDLLFQDAPRHGAILLVNDFARAFVDVNRGPGELDPKLILDIAATDLEAHSQRVKAGLGVIPRTVGDGVEIYARRITRQHAQARLHEVHHPWHAAIESSLDQVRQTNGSAILLDCHSMPSAAAGDPSCDVVLGDRFGASCAPLVINEAMTVLRAAGLKVVRNNPYAGGYTTCRYGRPSNQVHALQIEINRSLYMVEGAMTLRPSFAQIREDMAALVERLVEVSRTLRVRADG